ncbi:hypothetical protein TMES_10065 [Thalassospira mesophila]|uniref:Uncharacterized protein n=1 Tax=Thalassospira mesophila TaxID=1293891 RepID=A0A1Y2L364_9PROT|nr:hypothetical protein TMES_10065 [Thalassospira mesophila]
MIPNGYVFGCFVCRQSFGLAFFLCLIWGDYDVGYYRVGVFIPFVGRFGGLFLCLGGASVAGPGNRL